MLLNRDILVHCERERFSGGIALHIAIQKQDSDVLALAQPLMFVETEANRTYGEPCASLTQGVAQQLMDELWNCGLRPSEGTGSAGSLAATEKHLADMRALTYHVLKVPK